MTIVLERRCCQFLRFALEFHEYGSLPRYGVKAARFKDLRS